ncbi:MAG: GMC family oxidoreductase N-terminal domain-containing protein [Candidatus Kariarchaeaceae archaeon]|jgi:choline dehydrogenase-like flavoprotein
MDDKIYKPESIPEVEKFEFDVCIIGSGCGGAIAAAKISSMGYSVILLEEGPYVDYNDFNQNESILIPKLYRRGAGLGTDDQSMRILQGRVYGGSSTINWMTSLRTPDFVLNQWGDEFGLGTYNPKAMVSHFNEVEKRLNVHKISDQEHSPQNRIILDGCSKLGIHGDASFNNSIDCIGCGACGLGCYYDAKQDTRLTYLKDALESGIKVFTGTRAEKIDYLTKNKQIVLATILGQEYGLSNRIIKIHSKKLVVAASSVYTPLLLQNSGLTKGKLVGKFFHVHPVTGIFARYDKQIDPTYGIPQTALSEEYLNYDGRGYGWWQEVPDLEPFLAGVNFPGIGKQRREDMKALRNTGVIIVLVRDGANKKSNGEIKWKRGINFQNGHIGWKKTPSIRYRLCKQDKEHLIKGIENAAAIHFAAGAKEVQTLHNEYTRLTSADQISQLANLKSGPNQLGLYSAHPMGTARMASDSKLGVVSETLEMYHYPGIYIMDSSILPTALGVNPMITILSTISRAFELGSFDK